MLVRDRKKFNTGLLLMGSFLVVFVLIFVPFEFFGNQNSLHWADDLFNKLSKGSSYFIPEVDAGVKPIDGKEVNLNIKFSEPANVEKAVKLIEAAGLTATPEGVDHLIIAGDLGKLLHVVVRDADSMFKNDAKPLEAAYGKDGKEVMSLWWKILTYSIIPLQRELMVPEANAVNLVLKKAVEPAYNFYGIESESVKSKAGTVVVLLVFYVVYTMWYGFAIFDLFAGIGLTMSKSKVKKEV